MMIFQAALAASKKGEKFDAIGEQDVRFGTIHQDDLADLFLRVAERVSPSPNKADSRHPYAKVSHLLVTILNRNALPISWMLSSESQAQRDTTFHLLLKVRICIGMS